MQNNWKYSFVLAIIEYIALFIMLISSIAVIRTIWDFMHESPVSSAIELLAHLYGFVVSNIILIFMPKAKQMLAENQESENDE